MPGVLRQSTATTIKFGPFVGTDGLTPSTGLAGNGTEISKAGGAFASGPTLGTHDAEGEYPVALTTSNTDTVGILKIKSYDGSVHCPVWDTFQVVEEAVYDRDYAASATGYITNAPVNTAQVGGQTASASGTVTFPGTIASTTNITSASGVALSGTQTFNNTGTWTGNLSGSVGSVTATVSADIVSISGDSPAADNLERWFDGTVGFGTSGSVITGSLSGAVGSITGVSFPTNFASLAITATGAVGIDWGNVENQDTLVDFTQTSILQVQDPVSVSDLDAVAIGQIWTHATRTLTAGTNIVLAKGVGITGFNDLSAAQVNAEVDAGLADVGLTTTVTGRIDAAVSTRASATSLSTVDSNVSAILDDTGTSGVVLSAATCNKIADHSRRRTQANVFASSDGDAISKNSDYGHIQQSQRASLVGTTLTILNTDGSTLGTFTVTADETAEPLTGIS